MEGTLDGIGAAWRLELAVLREDVAVSLSGAALVIEPVLGQRRPRP